MTRTGRIIRGVGVGYASQLIMTLVGLWLTAFLLARLGERDYGLWLVATQILAYLMLADFGVVALLPREVAFATAREPGRVRETIGATLKLTLYQLPLVVLAGLAIVLLLPPRWDDLSGPLVLVVVTFALAFPLRTFNAALDGLQDLAPAGIIRIAAWAAGTIVTVVMVLAGYGLPALASGWAATQAATVLLAILRFVRSHAPHLPRELPRLTRAFVNDRLQRGAWVSMSQVASALLSGTDMLIIARFLGPAAVVPYFCTFKVLSVLQHQPRMINQASAPALAQLRVAESRDRVQSATAALGQSVMLLSGLVACVVIATNQAFVTWWVGAEQYGGLGLTLTLAAAVLARHLGETALYANFAFGHDRYNAIVNLVDGIITVGFSIILVRNLGAVGVAIGSLAGAVLISVPAGFTRLARSSGASTGRVLRPFLPWAWRFAVVAALSHVIAGALRPGILWLLAGGLVTTGAYAAVMWPLLNRAPLASYAAPRLARVRRMLRLA